MTLGDSQAFDIHGRVPHCLCAKKKITVIAVLTLGVIVSCVLLFQLSDSKQEMTMLGQFEESDFGGIIEWLKEEDIPHTTEGSSIFVPFQHASHLQSKILIQGLVTRGSLWYVFYQDSFSPGGFNYNHANAIQRALERVIEGLHGILKVHVIVDKLETRLLLQSKGEAAKASVYISTDGKSTSSETIKDIQNFVRDTIKDMTRRENVAVIIDDDGTRYADFMNSTTE